MNKKAQAAMEFLMTYGWAILVVLVVIGALAYFGVLSPSALLPEKCFLPIGLQCDEHLVKGGAQGFVSFDLRNGIGNNIRIVSMKVKKDNQFVCGRNYTTALMLKNGEAGTVRIPVSVTDPDYNAADSYCQETALGLFGSKYKYVLEVKYNREDKPNYVHTLEGELLTKVE